MDRNPYRVDYGSLRAKQKREMSMQVKPPSPMFTQFEFRKSPQPGDVLLSYLIPITLSKATLVGKITPPSCTDVVLSIMVGNTEYPIQAGQADFAITETETIPAGFVCTVKLVSGTPEAIHLSFVGEG